MQDYKVTMTKPWFGGSKTVYTTADSAEELAEKIESHLEEYLADGVTYKIEKL